MTKTNILRGLMAGVISLTWPMAIAQAQQAPVITPTGSEIVTCVASGVPKSCTTGSISSLGNVTPQTANKVYAGPVSGSATIPTFRILQTNDLPVGTSGSVIPLLSGYNTWTTNQIYNGQSISGGCTPSSDTIVNIWSCHTGGPNEYADVARYDWTAGGTGGTPGFVSSAVRVTASAAAGRTDFIWPITCSFTNNATAGENNCAYFQTYRMADGPTWTSTFELRDLSGTADPTKGAVTIEIDNFANGTDINGQRYMLDLVGGKAASGGAQAEIGGGIRIGPVNADPTQARFKRGVSLVTADFDLGFDTSTATFSTGGPAFRMSNGQYLSFTAFNDRKLGYNSSGLQYNTGSATLFQIDDVGNTYVGGTLRLAPMVFSNLPTCNSSNDGVHAHIIDASAAITTWHQQVTAGGGSNKAFITCNGTGWYAYSY